MLPLPQLLDGLGRGRLDVVQKFFSLHHRAFKSEFLSHLSAGAPFEEHVTRTSILFETIVNHLRKCDKTSSFGQSVLNLTLKYVTELIQDLESIKLAANSASIQQKKAFLELLNFHLNELQNLKKMYVAQPEAMTALGKFVTVAHVHSQSPANVLLGKLSSKTDEEVVRHALLSSDAVDLAYEVLFSRGGRSMAQISEYFQSVANDYINELLQKRQIEAAKDVLRNTDRDIWTSLKAVCLTTVDSGIRDYVALELNSLGLLEPLENDAWKFLILIESVIKNSDLKIKIWEETFEISKISNGETQLELSISNLLALPADIKASLKTALYFETLDRTLEPMLNKDECWRYLLSNDKLEIAIKWIKATHEETNESTKLDRLFSFLSSMCVTQDMIDFIPQSQCSPTTKDCLLDFLSKFSLYTTDESSDIHKRLLRNIRTSQFSNEWNERTKSLFIDLCVKSNMPDLLVSCDIKTDLQSPAWLKLYSNFQNLKDNSHSRSDICKIIELSANYLNIEFQNNHCIALALFLLSDQNLYDILHEPPENDANNRQSKVHLLQETLSHFPQLWTFLTTSTAKKPVDISLQSILRKKFSSDSTHHILKQDSLCSMFKENMDGCQVDFFHEPTIALYGHNETLDFQYFLKNGRPCHASMLVLAEVIRNFGKPSRKLLKRAILSAHELAFSNASDQMMTSSCIAFLEMLGEGSLTLRTHLATMKQIVSFRAEACRDERKKIAHELLWHQFLTEAGTLNVQDIFDLLLGSLPLDLYSQGLAVQFANLHKLPLPRKFLVHCARTNDWITFLLFCQIYNYPPDVVKIAAKQFRSPTLMEHLESFLCRYIVPTQCTSTSEFRRHISISRGSTSYMQGLKDLEQLPATTSSYHSSEEILPAPSVLSCVKDSLFGVLLACHNCSDPAAALLHSCVEMPCPVLAVLADYYQANSEAQLAAWLASWLPLEDRVNFECWQKNVPWPPEIIELVLLKSFDTSSSNLLIGFQIFIPEHPLVHVLEATQAFSIENQAQTVDALLVFQKLCLISQPSEQNVGNSWCLEDSSFILNIGMKMLFKFLESLPSVYEKRQFVQILCQTKTPLSYEGWVDSKVAFTGLYFPKKFLDKPCLHDMNVQVLHGASFDLSKLLRVLDILAPTEVEINIADFIKNSAEEIRKCNEKLINLGLYKKATDLSGEKFVIAEQTAKFKALLASNVQNFKVFCDHCNSCFEEAMVDPQEASMYFEMCAKDLQNNADRWRALHNAMKWLRRSSSNSLHSHGLELEKEMWQCFIRERDIKILKTVLSEELQHSPLSALCTTVLASAGCNLTFSEIVHVCDVLCDNQPCASKLMDCLLDIGDIVTASRVQSLFQSNHKDFELLVACVHLAEGKLKVLDIPANWSSFSTLNEQDPLNSGYSFNYSPDKEFKTSLHDSATMGIPSSEKLRVLATLQVLTKQLNHGKEIGKQVIACFRLAFNLELSYDDVVAVTNPLKLLRTAISKTYSGDYSIASNIMTALRLSPTERAEFISREVISAISKGSAPGNVKVFLLWGHDLEQYFQQLLELVPDPFLLGNQLMNMVNKLAIVSDNSPKTVLDTVVELLVRAHDCYTAGCHMEGISQVLCTVNKFTPILRARSEWGLMVRLLTGIQRYTEMNYMFKILKENDHFEFLLRKDSVKPLGFKLALLDWLRRECSHDIALLKMTAAHFQMHQQEAELWYKEGSDRLIDLVKQNLCNNQKTKSILQTSLQDFSHASECYLQANMLNHAMKCANQAELVALQLYLLSSPVEGSILCVIMLDSKSVSKLIVSTLSFNQALIVARAYNHRADWAAALFYHCVSPGLCPQEYFQAWSSCMELTPAIVQNIAYRLQRTTGVTREMTLNMQWLLEHVKDIDVRYKIASELGLKDMVETLLQAPEVAYLKDTVWQSGFKR